MPDEHGHPSRSEMRLASVLAALADPVRTKVVRDLATDLDDTERTCASFRLAVSKSTQTHHFRVLREAGLISQIDYGNSRKVKLRRTDLDDRFPGLLALVAAEDEPADD
jgi:DNA-binding transcriptional ArsR family regulator